MKKSLMILWCLPLIVNAQSFSDKITLELKFEKANSSNTLILANINGSMKVLGYDGDRILIEAERTIKAKTEVRLEQGKKEMQLQQIDRVDTLVVYVGGGCNHFGYKTSRRHDRRGWSYQSDCDKEDCNPPYDYIFNFTVKVPSGINLEVSTVNEGNVTVENVKGKVKAENVNGAIHLSALAGQTYASTINGDVEVEYSRNPNEDSRYYSLNGDINALFIKGLAANLSFKSFNGDLYTNVENLQGMSAIIEKKQDKEGTNLKIGGNRFKVGNGGALLDFETFNGDVIVKEKK